MAIAYNEGGYVSSVVSTFTCPPGGMLTLTVEDGDLLVNGLTVPERMVNDWYEQNWELGAMHCTEEDYDGEEAL